MVHHLRDNWYGLAGDITHFLAFTESNEYGDMAGHRKRLIDDVMKYFEYAGVNLAPQCICKSLKSLRPIINEHSLQYSINMNTADEKLVPDDAGAAGSPENFKARANPVDLFRKNQ